MVKARIKDFEQFWLGKKKRKLKLQDLFLLKEKRNGWKNM